MAPAACWLPPTVPPPCACALRLPQVLDEVQMMGDASRGWAFTRALLGIPACEVHVCGDPAALPLLERIAAETGERAAAQEGRAGGRRRVQQHLPPRWSVRSATGKQHRGRSNLWPACDAVRPAASPARQAAHPRHPSPPGR